MMEMGKNHADKTGIVCYCGIEINSHLRCDACTILAGPMHWTEELIPVNGKLICPSCFRCLQKFGHLGKLRRGEVRRKWISG